MTASLAKARWPIFRQHTALGLSTGCLRDRADDWSELARAAARESRTAVEFSALSEPELPTLIDYLLSGPSLPFEFISIHAPSKKRSMPEAELVGQLHRVAHLVDAIVIHPDQVEDPANYAPLGRKVVIENMDRRKSVGRTLAQLRPYFDALPEAGLCLDLAHAHHVDDSMNEGEAILNEYWARLRHLHLSSLDETGHHVSLTPEDEERFEPILDRCRDVPWILEAQPSDT